MDKLISLKRWPVLGVGVALLLIMGALIAASIPSAVSNEVSPPLAAANDNDDDGDSDAERIVSMVTVRSVVDPFPGHDDHQLAILIPLDTSGKVFTGTLSYSATQPVEVVVLFPYNPPAGPPSASHGEPQTVDVGGQLYAFTNLMTGKFGMVPFSGAGLALHTLNGLPFEATASIRAVVEDQTKTE